jgi:cbb3-type cytochrome oxidase cytochrome c subunit
MPSPDDTFFPLSRLHRLFAASAVLLLAATVWMIVADHCRPWKVYQRQFRDQVEPWITQARLRAARSDDFLARQEQLDRAWQESRRAVPDRALVARFVDQARQDSARRTRGAPDAGPLWAAYEALAARPSVEARAALLAKLNGWLSDARLARDNLRRQLQFRRAEFDQARSYYEAAVGQGRPPAELDAQQHQLDRQKARMLRLSAELDEATVGQQSLAALLAEIGRGEERARQALAEHAEAVDRLDRILARQEPNWGKWLLRLPIIDALGRPLAIEQTWLPELTIDYNFCQVPRQDRCTTCHQGIDRTLPGTATAGLLPHETLLSLSLATPGHAPQGPAGNESAVAAALSSTYGLVLAERGILDPQTPTIGLVTPKSPAAQALLAAGDEIRKINGHQTADRRAAKKYLLDEVAWGKPLAIEVRRGLPHPYASHPRLDLFVGPSSPHPRAQFGCTICHEGQGSATDFRWASHTPNDPRQAADWQRQLAWSANPDWDFPMLPARLAQSRCLQCHHDVTDLEPSRRFAEPPAPKLLAGYDLVRQYGCFGCHEINGFDDSGRRVGPDMRLEPNPAVPTQASAPGAAPGSMRKVGPSLRDVADRLDAARLEHWIARPAVIRPATRMPQLYGLDEHLEGQTLADVRRFEAVELRAISAYLLAESRGVTPLAPPAGVRGPPSPERGKRLFQTAGCLACHRHRQFPEGQSRQGPDLSNLGAQITARNAQRWLIDWIRDPARHAPRTTMPALTLDSVSSGAPAALPVKTASGDAAPPARATDPAADIAAWLLGDKEGPPEPLAPLVPTDLDELVLMQLRASFPPARAAEYLQQGIPQSLAAQISGDAALLLGPITAEKKLHYLGRRTIRRRGCFGCHEMAGLDDAQPIGPPLSDWGRKPTSLLAFEQVHRFVARSEQGRAGQGGARGGFFQEALLAHRREGFIWQKLRAPRSFDYQKAPNKGYLEQLTMGRFTLSDAEREAIITFVLGLTAAPPAQQFVFQPDRRQRAIAQGRKLLAPLGCAECHTLEMERWTIQYDPARFKVPKLAKNFDFLQSHVAAGALAASRRTDARGLGQVELVGMPRLDAQGRVQEDEDDDGQPVYGFSLWEPAAVGGQLWPVGGPEVLVGKSQIVRKRPPMGGDYARLLYPRALAEAKAAGSTASPTEAWGWVPPALANEGLRVQPAWLQDYLLAPRPIRPAAVLHMPKYALSPAEAGALADYFAAIAGAEFPYVSIRARQAAALEPQRAGRLDDAMRILLDRKTYCAKCHVIGDYRPEGDTLTSWAPNLQDVAQRIRPDYLRRWLADPRSVLPYTAMPVNFPPTGEPLGQDLLHGSSAEQLDAVWGLLLNYQEYTGRRTSMRHWVEEKAGADRPQTTTRP